MKVLVVDDSPDAAEPLIAFLHLRGCQTSLAHTAQDALQLAAADRPDLALLDIGLPEVDGWLLGSMLRSLPGLADLPIIAVTAYALREHRQKSAEAKFQHHLVKPVDYEMLGRLLKAFEPISDESVASQADPAAPGFGTPVPPPQNPVEQALKLPETPPESD